MEALTIAQIEEATTEFFKRLGKENFEIKNFSIQSAKIGDSFTCEANIHGDFDKFDFVCAKINRNGKLIVQRGEER
jgi:hypothetical protein